MGIIYGKSTIDIASKSTNGGRGIYEARREYPPVPKTLGERENKLLFDAQRATKGPFGQRSGWSLHDGEEDSRDTTIRCLQDEMVEVRQVIVANNFKMPAPRAGEGSSQVRSIR